ncbi:hypothetical protein [Lacticaseibacillus phage Lphi2ADMT26]|nr:hypothetical protein [Lacticaseibacillus phage Lphi2ADMT26]
MHIVTHALSFIYLDALKFMLDLIAALCYD